MRPVSFILPIRLRNPLNGAQGVTRGAMLKASANRKRERAIARSMVHGHMFASGCSGGATAYTITITRIAPRSLDHDGLVAGAKSIRDGISDGLGFKNDSDPALDWIYDQRKGKPKEYAVHVEIKERQELYVELSRVDVALSAAMLSVDEFHSELRSTLLDFHKWSQENAISIGEAASIASSLYGRELAKLHK